MGKSGESSGSNNGNIEENNSSIPDQSNGEDEGNISIGSD